jgi:hypothetical protein
VFVNVPRDPLVPGYGRSVRNSAATDKTASPVIHATRKAASIGLEPTAARTNMSRLKATTPAAATMPRRCRTPYLLLAKAIIA